MSEMPKALSISFHSGDGCLEHNNRVFYADNVDQSRTSDNIIYVRRDLHELYHELFDDALAEYNSKQTRKDRVIDDYYEHIRRGGKEKLFQEVIVMFGNQESCGINSEDRGIAIKMLDEYMKEFERRNPQLKVFNAVMHLDEATPHLHINFVPVCYGQKQGLSTRVSMKRAIQQMGFTASGKKQTEAILWGQSERKILTGILNKNHIYRRVVGAKNERTLKEYKEYQNRISELNSHITALKKKNPVQLTSDEVGEIINQNDYLRGVIEKQRTEMAELRTRATSDFVPLDVYSDQKRQYIIECLKISHIPFVEENHSIYFPECYKSAVNKTATAFKPYNNQTIRERLKFYIDRLIYSANSLDALFDLLKNNGYEVKFGKYIAVKPPYSKRFIRLRSLGEDYTDAALKQRICTREGISDEYQRKEQQANEAQKPFYTAVNGTIGLVRTLRYTPVKSDKDRMYSFDNDLKISGLVECIHTLNEYNIASREKLYRLADSLQEQIENCDDDDTRLDLKAQYARIESVIGIYEEIVEGNFIDNLIKAEKERIEAENRTVEQHKAVTEPKEETKNTSEQKKPVQTVNRKHHRR